MATTVGSQNSTGRPGNALNSNQTENGENITSQQDYVAPTTDFDIELQEWIDANTENENPTDNTPNPNRKRSVAWKYFTEVKKQDKSRPTHATCNYCNIKLACNNRNGTSTLSRQRCPKHSLFIAERYEKRQKLLRN